MLGRTNGRIIVVIHSDIREVRWIAILLNNSFPGAAVRQFTDADSSLRYFSDHHADVVLQESGMRCRDGSFLLQMIRDKRPGLPVIAVSKNGRFAERNPDGRLSMPLNAQTLSETIRTVSGVRWQEENLLLEDSVW